MIALLIAIIASAGVAVGASSLGGGGGGGGGGGSATAAAIIYNTEYPSTNAEYYRTAEYNAQYGLDTINAAEAYASLADQDKEVAGNGVKIGVVDSGIQADHIEIAANLDSANSASYITGDTSIVDGRGHGTHVASTAAGAKDGHGMHGVAYEADIVVARVLNDSGSGSFADVASGINGVVADDVGVINLSLGGSSSSVVLTALQAAAAADTVIVAATGNDGDTEPGYPASNVISTGVIGFGIAVGAVNSDLTIASFSNECGTTKDYCLVAPGVSIYAAMPAGSTIDESSCTGSGYCAINGTSMATPHVAGAAAVLRAAWPSLTADDVVALLLETATDLGAAGVDDIFGKGLLNLEAAVAPVGGASLSSGSSVDSAGYDISTASLTVDPIFGDAFSTNVASQLNSAVFFDDFGRDFKADLGSKITQTASYTVPTLDNYAFNNYSNKTIPLSFGNNLSSQLKFQVKSYNDYSETGNGLSKNYSKNRYGLKFLTVDKSQEDKYLTNSESFSFTQDVSKGLQAGFAFNSNEAANIRNDKFNNFGFISVNNYAANPYQSFATTNLSSTTTGNQRNYNQLFVSKKFFDNKFSANFLQQNSYETYSAVSKIGNRQNQVSDFNLTYLPSHESNFSVSFGNLNEFDNNFLNSKSLGAFETAGDVKTSYFKISSTKKLAKNFYLISSFSEGQTKANGNDLGIFRDYSDIKSRSSSIGLVNDNILGGKIGMIYSEPLRVYAGKASINIATGRDANGNVTRYTSDVSLKSQGKEQDIELFYSRNLSQDSQIKFNFITQKEPGSVKSAANNYLGFMTYGKKF